MKITFREDRMMAYDYVVSERERDYLDSNDSALHDKVKEILNNISLGDYSFDKINEIYFTGPQATASGKNELTINIDLTYIAEVEGKTIEDCKARFEEICSELNTGDLVEIGDPCKISIINGKEKTIIKDGIE